MPMKIKGSHTLMACYQVCPHQCFHRYVAKDVKFVKTKAVEDGDAMHTAMDKRLSSGVPLPPDWAKMEPVAASIDPHKPRTEVRLGMREDGTACGFYDADCWMCVKLDCWMEADNAGLLLDWKTGKRREDDFELRIGALLAYAANPELRKAAGYYFWANVGPGGTLGTKHDLSDFERTFKECDAIMGHVEQAINDNWFPKRQGPLCAYCNVIDCEFNSNPDKDAYR